MSLFPPVKGPQGQLIKIQQESISHPSEPSSAASIGFSLIPPVHGRPQIQLSEKAAPTIPQPLQSFPQFAPNTQSPSSGSSGAGFTTSFIAGGPDFAPATTAFRFGNNFTPSRPFATSSRTPFDPTGQWSHIRASLVAPGRMIKEKPTPQMLPLDWSTGRRANRPFENIYPRVPTPSNIRVPRRPLEANPWGEQQAAFYAMEPPSNHPAQQHEPAVEDASNIWGGFVPYFAMCFAMFFVLGQLLLVALAALGRKATAYVVAFSRVLRTRAMWEHVTMVFVALLLVLYVIPFPKEDVKVMQTAVEVAPEYIIMIPYQVGMGSRA